MRVLQLIDSLRPGGAEKMAVNIANALLPHVEESFLCCTRQEGMLKEQLNPEVKYLYLKKKNSLDLKALLKLRKYILQNKITIVHAHSTSFFLAGLLKMAGLNFELIWHDHYGNSEFLGNRSYGILKFFSRYFAGIISVNRRLKEWAKIKLKTLSVIEIKNFIPDPPEIPPETIKLNGDPNAFKVICVANLRPQKDHHTLIKAYELLDPNLNVSLHLVGEDPGTAYSASVLKAIKISSRKKSIFYYGEQSQILSLLQQADLGILASRSEGLPLALLDYGMAGLAVICTDVGQCSGVLGKGGILVKPGISELLAEQISKYYRNSDTRLVDAAQFHKRVKEMFSSSRNIFEILNFYQLIRKSRNGYF